MMADNIVDRKIRKPVSTRLLHKLSTRRVLVYPGCQRFFLSLGETELSGEAAKASREAARKKLSRRQALLALTLLAAGEREDLWHPV